MLALQTMMVPLLLYLPPTYYSPAVGLSLGAVGLAFMLGRIFEAFSDPVIGAKSDRTRSPFGPRRPWMVVGTPIAIIAAWFLLTPGPGTSFTYLLFSLLVFYVGWTMVYIPHQSWGGELSADYHERTRIAGFRETGSFLGYLLAAVVPLVYWRFLRGVAAPSFEQIVHSIGVLFAVTLPLGVLWCLVAVPARQAGEAEAPPGWGELFAILKRNRPFQRLGTAYLFDRLAMGVYFAAQPLLIGLVFGMMDNLLVIALVNTIAAAAFAPMWIPVARRLGKHRTYVLANFVTMLSYALLFVAQSGELWWVLLANVVMGCGNGGTMITPPAMAADTVDYDELRSGLAQMGGHMAFLAFVFKTGMAIGVAIGLPFIGLFGYQGLGSELSETAALGIRLCASWLPILLLIPAIALMWRFPLDAARHEIIRRRLEKSRRSAR